MTLEHPDWSAPPSAVFQTYNPSEVTATEAGQLVTATLASAGHFVRLQSITLSAAIDPVASQNLRGGVVLIVSDPDGAAWEVVAGISPANPVARVSWPPGAGPLTQGRRLSLTYYSLRGVGGQACFGVVDWYEV